MNPETDPSPTRDVAPVIALTGFMAAGKSTIGRSLSRLLHWDFVDLDLEIEARANRRIREMFEKNGEPRFRQLETKTLGQLLRSRQRPTVIALGGGTFVQRENAELLRARGARVVFLALEIGELLRRCREAAGQEPHNPRPLADDETGFCALYQQRLPFYQRAELTVDARDKSAEQVASEIATALGLPATGKNA